MPFSPIFDYENIAATRFPQHIMTKDIIPNLQITQQEWNAFLTVVKGVYPDTKLDLDKIPFVFRFLGNYAGEIEFNGHKINLQGTNPLAAWTGKEFIVPTGMGDFAGYPIGAVLPFFTNPPDGWIKLVGQFYYIETGEINHDIQPSQNKKHSHEGSQSQAVNDGANWTRAQGQREYAGSLRNENSAQPIDAVTYSFDTIHSHDGQTDWEGGSAETDEARPPHVKSIFARRIS